jgi:hypothetical protein
VLWCFPLFLHCLVMFLFSFLHCFVVFLFSFLHCVVLFFIILTL